MSLRKVGSCKECGGEVIYEADIVEKGDTRYSGYCTKCKRFQVES